MSRQRTRLLRAVTNSGRQEQNTRRKSPLNHAPCSVLRRRFRSPQLQYPDNPMQRPQPLVAIVDDDPGIRKSLEVLLNAFGYRVAVYATAEEFLVTTPAERPSCV